MNQTELQRLADDPEIQEAIATLSAWGIDGAVYDKLMAST